MRDEEQPNSNSPFDSIRHLDEEGNEYWSGRDLARVLGYTTWASFMAVIEQARQVATGSGLDLTTPLKHIATMIKKGTGTNRKIQEVHLTCYGCYVVAMHASSSNEIAKHAQTYFAHYTHQPESSVDYNH
jgi:DNA-damage-inducible protein D